MTVGAAPAAASRWALAGGDPGRSGNQEAAPGTLPAGLGWSVPAAAVRTPMIVTGGLGPAVQRVAYGTQDGRVHLRVLATGAEVGPPGGTLVADASFTDPATTFGSVAFADGGTEEALGVLYVVHNDGGGVEIARFDEATGARLDKTDIPVPDSLGCTVAGSPLLTPPVPGGSRVLLFTLAGRCSADSSLVRVPLGPGASGTVGPFTFARFADLTADAAPTLLILRDATGQPRFYTAVGRRGGVDFFDASRAFTTQSPAAPTPPDLTLAVDAGEAVGATAATPSGLYVMSASGSVTRVRRMVQEGTALRVAQTRELPGTPVPGGLAVDASGTVVVTSAGLAVLRTGDLSPVGGTAGVFGAPAVSGRYGYLVGPSGPTGVRLSDAALTPLGGLADDRGVAPALARGLVVVGAQGHAAVYGTADVQAPTLAPSGDQRLGSVVSVRAADDRGVASVAFRLAGLDLGQVVAPAEGSSFSAAGARYETPVRPTALPPGSFTLETVARDAAGNAARAVRSVITPPCARRVHGGRRADHLRGGPGRDCLDGGRGADRLDGRAGADLVRGGGGRDVIRARDGSVDVVRCGPGRDTVLADRVDLVAADCERVRLK